MNMGRTALQGQKTATKMERNSSFEILRIFGMYIILTFHCLYNGGAESLPFNGGINRFAEQFFMFGGNLGIDIFFVLSGYFLVNSKFRLEKLLKLNFAAIFYSVAALVFLIIHSHIHVDAYTWLRSVFPLLLENHWFVMVYAVIYVLSPMLNKAINSLDKKHFTVICAFMFVMVCVIPVLSFPMRSTILLGSFLTGFYGYFIGAYLRKYPISFMDNKLISGIIFLVCCVLIGFFSYMGVKHSDNHMWVAFKDAILAKESMLMIICTVAAMMFCKNLNIGNVKPINFISQTTLGIYLIHETPSMRGFLWRTLVKGDRIFGYKNFMIYVLGITAGLFLCFSAIDILRIYLLENNLFKLKLWKRPCEKADKFMNDI